MVTPNTVVTVHIIPQNRPKSGIFFRSFKFQFQNLYQLYHVLATCSSTIAGAVGELCEEVSCLWPQREMVGRIGVHVYKTFAI